MNENSFYFDHDYNARTDQKILKLRAKFGLEGYGLFWCVIESMACDSTGYLDGSAMDVLSLSFGLPVEKVTEQIQFMLDIGLIEKCSHGNLFNTRIIDHKLFRAERSRTGKKGSDKRWKNQQVNSSANSSANAYDRKGDRKIEDMLPPPTLQKPWEETDHVSITGTHDEYMVNFCAWCNAATLAGWFDRQQPEFSLVRLDAATQAAITWLKTKLKRRKKAREFLRKWYAKDQRDAEYRKQAGRK